MTTTFSPEMAESMLKKSIDDYISQFPESHRPEPAFIKTEEGFEMVYYAKEESKLFTILSGMTKVIEHPDVQAQEPRSDLTISNNKSEFSISLRYANPKLTYKKKDMLTEEDINLLIDGYRLANPIIKKEEIPETKITEAGARIYHAENWLDFDYIAGYEKLKNRIKTAIIIPLNHQNISEKMLRLTRRTYETNAIKAILFEGPPGTGKTTMSKIIGKHIGCPVIYVPIETILSKWYGESSKKLGELFDAADRYEKNIIFIDELESLATTRDDEMHEETRRLLAVLFCRIDGYTKFQKSILIGSTNRKGLLDEALMNRFDVVMHFHSPNLDERTAIFSNYAMHLDNNSLRKLARKSKNFSGRDIKHVCEAAERTRVTRIANKQETELAPSLEDYMEELKLRKISR